MNELQAQSSLQDYLESQEQTEREAFTVKDDQQANWALRKIKQFQDQKENNNALAVSEIEKIESWNKSENENAQQSIDYFQGLLAYYAQSKRDQDPKFKKLTLPNGALKFTKQQPKWHLDNDVVLKKLKESEELDLIKVVESPKLAEIKKSFKVQGGKAVNPKTGEIVEGITIEERDDEFGVVVDD